MVRKWGNSFGIRIPSAYIKEFDLKGGSLVEIKQNRGRLVIIPKKNTLDDLLSKVDDKNMQEYIDTGSSVGKEEW